jgi:hypothetical protein
MCYALGRMLRNLSHAPTLGSQYQRMLAKTPAPMERAFRTLASNRCAGNTVDVGAIDPEVAQFAGGHTAKFGNRLTILAPVVEGACYVHNDPLS